MTQDADLRRDAGPEPRAAEQLCGRLSGRRTTPRASPQAHPLIVALHGGTFNSAYFDVPGYSLLDRAQALNLPVLAPDRPGYGASAPLPPGQDTVRGNADFLARELRAVWDAHRGAAPGVVLIGHSIGGAIAMMIAAQELEWPLLGLAVSGVGLRTPDYSRDAWSALPDIPFVELPGPIKDDVMFGSADSFTSDMPAASHVADAPVPRTEILDIVTTWHDDVAEVASRITAPLHYRQGGARQALDCR